MECVPTDWSIGSHEEVEEKMELHELQGYIENVHFIPCL